MESVNTNSWFYQTETAILIPFKEEQFSEQFLANLYVRTRDDGLLDRVFPGMGNMNMNRFISYLRGKLLLIYCVKPGTVAGFAWITESDGVDGARKAAFGFCFFREWQAKQQTRDLVWLCLHWWFDVLKIDILFGMTLTTNKLAQNFSKIFGFQYVGDVPKFLFSNGRLVGATMLMLERERFMPLFDEWKMSLKT